MTADQDSAAPVWSALAKSADRSAHHAKIGSSAVPAGAPRDIRLGQVVSQRELISRRGEWKRTGKGVVCAYGAFDLLHPGHIRLLEAARDFGDLLVVGVQSDAAVRAAARNTNGSPDPALSDAVDRPITPATERAEILAALRAVDFAAIVEDSSERFLEQFRPDVFVCGDSADVRRNTDTDSLERALTAVGCRVVRVATEPGYSITLLIERITGRRA